MATLIGNCPKCQGNLYNDHGTVKCLQCGQELMDPQERRTWYQANRDEMTRDLVQLGNTKTVKKWGIKPQHISHLKGTELYNQLVGKPAPVSAPSTNHLPGLPAFSNDWSAEVQIKWLEVWADRSN